LADYGREHGPETAAPDRIGYAIDALLPFWRGRAVADITRATCQAYARARERKPATVRRELAVLRAAINHAAREGRLTRAPTVFLPPKPDGKDRWLTRSEVAALLRQARHDPRCRLYLPLFVLLGLYTGARKQAILGLRWPQVDLARGRIDFNPPGRARTGKGRPIIPIPRRLLCALRRARARSGDLGYVVNRDGRRVGDVKKAFASACRRAGLAGVSPHTLRHTAGTWMAQASVPLWEVAGYLGHSTARTAELYAHHAPDHLARAREAFR
jgi:integrase